MSVDFLVLANFSASLHWMTREGKRDKAVDTS
jgi:hypothetical protein